MEEEKARKHEKPKPDDVSGELTDEELEFAGAGKPGSEVELVSDSGRSVAGKKNDIRFLKSKTGLRLTFDDPP